MTAPILTPRYTSNAEVLQLCGLASDDASINSTQLTNWIMDMEDYIDRVTHRNFVADSVATDRYFDSPKMEEGFVGHRVRNSMYFDECVSVEEVAVDGIILTPIVDYVLEPYNELPVRKITFLNGLGSFGYEKPKNIRIQAKWGYSVDAPRPIKFAAAVFASGIVNNILPKTNAVKSEKLGDYAVTYDADLSVSFDRALDTIKEYQKIYV